MLKKIRTISAALMLLCGMAACLPEYNTQHDINIARFYFRASDTAPDINSIEFAVDTVAMTISNADSLAFTSSLAQVVPVIECYSVPSAIAINGVEWNQTDTLDLSSQPVTITIVGSDKVTSCDYVLTVNQHKVDPDSVIWTNRGDVFAECASASDLYAIPAGDRCYLAVSKADAGGSMYVTENGLDWAKLSDYGCDINIRTINVLYTVQDGNSAARLFAIGGNAVYEWGGNEWILSKDAVADYSYIDVVGGTDGKLAVLTRNEQDGLFYMMILENGQWSIEQTPQYLDFPVSGAGKFSNGDIPYLIGGRGSAGNYLGTIYSSYDLSYWTNLLTSASGFDFGNRANAAVFYLDGKIYLYGGAMSDANVSSDMYCSADNGFSWNRASAKQNLPGEYGARQGASAFVGTDENVWLVGGFTSDGVLSTDLWQGRMNKSDFLIR